MLVGLVCLLCYCVSRCSCCFLYIYIESKVNFTDISYIFQFIHHPEEYLGNWGGGGNVYANTRQLCASRSCRVKINTWLEQTCSSESMYSEFQLSFTAENL